MSATTVTDIEAPPVDNVTVYAKIGHGAKKVGKGAKKIGKKSLTVAQSVFEDFKAFLNRGSVVDLAVGIVIGAAFTSIVTSLVTDLITPLISLSSTQNTLAERFYVLRCPKNGTDCDQFTTVKAATAAGAITWNYGNFVQTLINFLIISVVVFFIVKAYSATKRTKPAAPMKNCEFCLSLISVKAARCPQCTSQLSVTVAETEKKME